MPTRMGSYCSEGEIMKQVLKLTLEDAKKMMDGAINKAIEIENVDMDIAIVDDGGHLMLFTRMDNARITSIKERAVPGCPLHLHR